MMILALAAFGSGVKCQVALLVLNTMGCGVGTRPAKIVAHMIKLNMKAVVTLAVKWQWIPTKSHPTC